MRPEQNAGVAPQPLYSVDYAADVLETIRAGIATPGVANRDVADVGGVLFGRHEDGKIILSRAAFLGPNELGRSAPLHDSARFSELLFSATDEPVGWFRSTHGELS